MCLQTRPIYAFYKNHMLTTRQLHCDLLQQDILIMLPGYTPMCPTILSACLAMHDPAVDIVAMKHAHLQDLSMLAHQQEVLSDYFHDLVQGTTWW